MWIGFWGVAKLVKAPDFDSGMRGFESYLPSPIPHPMPFSRGEKGISNLPSPLGRGAGVRDGGEMDGGKWLVNHLAEVNN